MGNVVVTNSDTTGRADTLSAKAAKISTIAVAILAGAVICAVVLVRAQTIVLALLAAIVIAEAIRPLVDRVTSRVPRGAAIGLVFAAVLLALIVVWLIPLQALLPQALALWATLPTLIAEYAPRLPASAPSVLLNVLVSREHDFAQNLSMVGLAFVMALFWFGASSKLRATALSFAQGQRRTTLDSLFSELGDGLRLYVVGALINGAIVGVMCALGLAWMRSPFPLALGVLEGLLVAIPYVGPFVGVVLAGAVAFALQGLLGAGEAIAVVSLANTLEGTFVAPLIFQRGLNVDPLAVLLGTAIGGALFGVAGIVLAVPVVSVLQTIIVRMMMPALRGRRPSQGVQPK
jgi:predicted PurR-regulated permease PerM